jgi:hypothetical protein
MSSGCSANFSGEVLHNGICIDLKNIKKTQISTTLMDNDVNFYITFSWNLPNEHTARR